jgi:hypothetical protein
MKRNALSRNGEEASMKDDSDAGTSNSKPPQRYNLRDLLSESDCTLPRSQEEREWVDMPAAGREIPYRYLGCDCGPVPL